MDFNIDKCKVMHIGRNNPVYKYSMNNSVLQEVKQEKDQGIMITSDLKFFSQVTKAHKKANRALGMISRLIQYKSKSVLLIVSQQDLGQTSPGVLYTDLVTTLR